jgi:hypothetical protein
MRPAVTPKPQLQVSRQFVASQSRIFNQAFTNQAVEAPDKPALKNNHLRVAPIDEEYLARGKGWIMSHVKKIFCSSLECSLFNQIVGFSSAGLAASLSLVLACDLRIENWI